MAKRSMSKIFRKVSATMAKHSPEILTGVGIVGMVTTTVLAVKATPKALQLIEDEKNSRISDISGEEDIEFEEKLPVKDIIKATWKCYAPAIVTGTASAACLIGANRAGARRAATFYAAYKLSESTLSDYKAKVVETIGEAQEKEIQDKVIEEKVSRLPVVQEDEIIATGQGEDLCIDLLSGRRFRSSMNSIEAAVNRLNKRLLSYDYVSLNEFYDELNLKNVKIGEILGWNMCRDSLVEISFSTQLYNGKPHITIDYIVEPRYDYHKNM